VIEDDEPPTRSDEYGHSLPNAERRWEIDLESLAPMQDDGEYLEGLTLPETQEGTVEIFRRHRDLREGKPLAQEAATRGVQECTSGFLA
jgi:hypothetical protein